MIGSMAQNVMSGYYGPGYQQPVDPHRVMDTFVPQEMVPDIGPGMVDTTMTGGEGQTLDQIISQNDLEFQRRRSNYHPAFQANGNQEAHIRRSSMLEFGGNKNRDRGEFQFDPSPSQPSLSTQIPAMAQPQKSSGPRRIRSRESLALDTRFNNINATFGNMTTYSPAMMTSTPLDLDPTSQYLSSNMDIPMNFEGGGADRTAMNIQPQIEQQPLFSASPTHQNFSPMFQGVDHESPAGHGLSMDQSLMDKVARMRMPDSMQGMSVMNRHGTSPRSVMPTTRGPGESTMTTSPNHNPPTSMPTQANIGTSSPYGAGCKPFSPNRIVNRTDQGTIVLNGSTADLADHGLGKPPDAKFMNIYAPSGFDMLGVLVSVLGFPR